MKQAHCPWCSKILIDNDKSFKNYRSCDPGLQETLYCSNDTGHVFFMHFDNLGDMILAGAFQKDYFIQVLYKDNLTKISLSESSKPFIIHKKELVNLNQAVQVDWSSSEAILNKINFLLTYS